MKKLLISLLTIALLFTMAACGGNGEGGLVSGSGETFGENVLIEARITMEENKDADPLTIVTKLSERKMFEEMSLMPVELDPSYAPGLDASALKGYDKAALMSPMIGVIPFVTYVFQVSEGTDANAFAEQLKTIADPNWNICTSADETLTFVEGNTVIFLMSPASME